MIANKYAGRCGCGCGSYVGANQGGVKKIGTKWVVFCKASIEGQKGYVDPIEDADEPSDARCPGCEHCDGEGDLLSNCQRREQAANQRMWDRRFR